MKSFTPKLLLLAPALLAFGVLAPAPAARADNGTWRISGSVSGEIQDSVHDATVNSTDNPLQSGANLSLSDSLYLDHGCSGNLATFEQVQGHMTVTWTYDGTQPDASSYALLVRVVCGSDSLTNEDPYEFDLGAESSLTGFNKPFDFTGVPQKGADGVWTMTWTSPYLRACAAYQNSSASATALQASGGRAYVMLYPSDVPSAVGGNN